MPTETEILLMRRLDDLSSQINRISVSVAKLESWSEFLGSHDKRLTKLETWQARLIGGYAAAAILIGIAFQIFLRAVAN
jgi:hypothetical protein